MLLFIFKDIAKLFMARGEYFKFIFICGLVLVVIFVDTSLNRKSIKLDTL